MAVDQWMGPAAVVDLTHLGENGEVTAVDLLPATPRFEVVYHAACLGEGRQLVVALAAIDLIQTLDRTGVHRCGAERNFAGLRKLLG